MKVKPLTMYECPGCGFWFKDPDDAKECCFDNSGETQYRCGECGEVHDDLADAKDCCRWKM